MAVTVGFPQFGLLADPSVFMKERSNEGGFDWHCVGLLLDFVTRTVS